MMEFTKVGMQTFIALGTGAVLFFTVPLVIALIWCMKKKERFSTVLAGAATFLLFALVLEKPIQNVLLFPTAMGMEEHVASRFFAAHPVLLALAAGLFPGVFEETGRLVAFKTVLKNRKNRETSISHGIGHGGVEVMLILGVTYVTYISYAAMINAGTFGTVIDQVAAQAPDQVDAALTLARQIPAMSFADVGLNAMERVFAFLFHVGASMLVFYACKDKKRFWLYSLAVVLHTVIDFVGASYLFEIGNVTMLMVEACAAVIGILTFCGAYFLLYKKEVPREYEKV